MVDSVERASSIPVQPFHTEQGVHNPLPLNAPKELDRIEDVAKQTDGEETRADFENYLNQASIMTLEKNQASSKIFDPAGDIIARSVYAQPNDKTSF